MKSGDVLWDLRRIKGRNGLTTRNHDCHDKASCHVSSSTKHTGIKPFLCRVSSGHMRNAACGLLTGDYATKVRRLSSDGRAYVGTSDGHL